MKTYILKEHELLEKIMVVLFFSIISIVYVQWTWTDKIGMFGGDNAWYLLTAKFLSPYSEHAISAEYFARNSPYPIVMPLLLAVFGGAESVGIAHLITTVFLLFSMMLLYQWLILLGQSVWLALGVVVAFSTIPMTYMHSLEILSENYFLFFCLLSIVVIERLELAEEQFKGFIFAGFIVGLSILVRSTGITLIMAFVFYVYMRFSVKQVCLLCIPVFLPLLVATLFSIKESQGISYIALLFEELEQINSFALAIQHMKEHIFNFLNGWYQIFEVLQRLEKIVFFVIAMICLVGMMLRLINKKFDGFFVLAYILLLLAWPFSFEAARYLYPILAILLVQGLYCIAYFKSISNIKVLVQYVFVFVILISNFPALAGTYFQYNKEIPEMLQPYKHTSLWYQNSNVSSIHRLELLTQAIKNIKSTLPENECVFSIKPSIVGMLSERISYQPPKEKLDQHEFIKEVNTIGCNYFFVMPFSSITYSSAFYPYQRIKENSKVVFVKNDSDNKTIAALLKINDI